MKNGKKKTLRKSIKKKQNREGRPSKFKSVADLQKKINAYFLSCWAQKLDMFGNPVYRKNKKGKKTNDPVMIQIKPYTITGLAVALETNRETLLNYQKKDEYFDTIKRAKQMCHAYAEESLFIGKNPTGAIFNLKNNWGWKDKTETDLTSAGKKLTIIEKIYPPLKDGK